MFTDFLKQRFPAFTFCLLLGAGNLHSQGTAEHAITTARMAAAAQGSSSSKTPALPEKPTATTHLPARPGETVQVLNRRALERQAGEQAAQLLLRSVPSPTRVWINDKLVGQTPLLLILAPGSYRIELRGERTDAARSEVTLLPREKRELVLVLQQRYPATVRLP